VLSGREAGSFSAKPEFGSIVFLILMSAPSITYKGAQPQLSTLVMCTVEAVLDQHVLGFLIRLRFLDLPLRPHPQQVFVNIHHHRIAVAEATGQQTFR
jgi:hypothetical protein